MSDEKQSKIVAGVWLRDAKSGSGKYFSGSVDNRAKVFIEFEESDETGTHTVQYEMQYFRITRNQKKTSGDKKPEYIMWADVEVIGKLDDEPGLVNDIPF